MKKLLKNLVKGIAIVGLILTSATATAQANIPIQDWYISHQQNLNAWTVGEAWVNGEMVSGIKTSLGDPRFVAFVAKDDGNYNLMVSRINGTFSDSRGKVDFIFDNNSSAMLTFDGRATESNNNKALWLTSPQADTWGVDNPTTQLSYKTLISKMKSSNFAHIRVTVNSTVTIFKISLRGSSSALNKIKVSQNPFGPSNPFGTVRNDNPFQR